MPAEIEAQPLEDVSAITLPRPADRGEAPGGAGVEGRLARRRPPRLARRPRGPLPPVRGDPARVGSTPSSRATRTRSASACASTSPTRCSSTARTSRPPTRPLATCPASERLPPRRPSYSRLRLDGERPVQPGRLLRPRSGRPRRAARATPSASATTACSSTTRPARSTSRSTPRTGATSSSCPTTRTSPPPSDAALRHARACAARNVRATRSATWTRRRAIDWELGRRRTTVVQGKGYFRSLGRPRPRLRAAARATRRSGCAARPASRPATPRRALLELLLRRLPQQLGGPRRREALPRVVRLPRPRDQRGLGAQLRAVHGRVEPPAPALPARRHARASTSPGRGRRSSRRSSATNLDDSALRRERHATWAGQVDLRFTVLSRARHDALRRLRARRSRTASRRSDEVMVSLKVLR